MTDEHMVIFVILAVLWTLPWKAWALWLAARRTEKWWFLALLIVNTFAVLEIIYIFLIAKRQDRATYGEQPEDDIGTT